MYILAIIIIIVTHKFPSIYTYICIWEETFFPFLLINEEAEKKKKKKSRPRLQIAATWNVYVFNLKWISLEKKKLKIWNEVNLNSLFQQQKQQLELII